MLSALDGLCEIRQTSSFGDCLLSANSFDTRPSPDILFLEASLNAILELSTAMHQPKGADCLHKKPDDAAGSFCTAEFCGAGYCDACMLDSFDLILAFYHDHI